MSLSHSFKVTLFVFLAPVVVFVAYCVLCFVSVGHGGGHRRVWAQTEVKTFELALKKYLHEYDRWPVPSNSTETVMENARLMRILQPERRNDELLREYNPKMFQFLLPESSLMTDAGEYVDYWGSPYNVIVDVNLDGKIRIGDRSVERPVAAWSNGKNGRNEWGEGDDICSWEL